jgi:type II secretory pathway pseudopilin PulG
MAANPLKSEAYAERLTTSPTTPSPLTGEGRGGGESATIFDSSNFTHPLIPSRQGRGNALIKHFARYSSCGGFTYIAALMLIVVMGIMLGAAAQSWTMAMKRERETELLFRGKQIVQAIYRWQNPQRLSPGQRQPAVRPLQDLKHLVQDPQSLTKIRFLRRDPATLYNDPITGKEWNIIRDPVKGIIGVASTSVDTPVKQGGFVEMFPLSTTRDAYLITMFKNFEGKQKYSEWQFVVSPTPAAGTVALPGTAPITAPPNQPQLPVPPPPK